MKLLAGTKSKINNNENSKYVPLLEVTEVVLVYCKIAKMVINIIQESFTHFLLINVLVKS